MKEAGRCDGCGESLNTQTTAIRWRTGYGLCVDCWSDFTPFERVALALLMDIRDKVHGETEPTAEPHRALTLAAPVDEGGSGPDKAEKTSPRRAGRSREPKPVRVSEEGHKFYDRKAIPAKCPSCGFPLREKDGRYGPFFGCTNFPNCRRTFTIEVPASPAQAPAASDSPY